MKDNWPDNSQLIEGRGGLALVLPRQRVMSECVSRGWSLTRLAREAGISRPTMTAILNNRPVRPATAWKVASALGRAPSSSLLTDWEAS